MRQPRIRLHRAVDTAPEQGDRWTMPKVSRLTGIVEDVDTDGLKMRIFVSGGPLTPVVFRYDPDGIDPQDLAELASGMEVAEFVMIGDAITEIVRRTVAG